MQGGRTPAVPELANVFYYGKEFGSPMQGIQGGQLVQNPYRQLSVTDPQQEEDQLLRSAVGPGAVAAGQPDAAPSGAVAALIERLLQESGGDLSPEDLLNIIRRG